jgi:hypothetical protein
MGRTGKYVGHQGEETMKARVPQRLRWVKNLGTLLRVFLN